ncbi:MAG: multiheme c-type cytochrome [bacterium]
MPIQFILNEGIILKIIKLSLIFILTGIFLFKSYIKASECVGCHTKVNPGIVADWQLSKHSNNDIDCSFCHGLEHKSERDVEKVQMPTTEICDNCHEEQVKQFKNGKHSLAWISMNAMPTAHWQPKSMVEGMKGCGGCHKIGLKTKAEIRELKKESLGYGIASCSVCHTRHTFSKEEASQPQACQTCHMGFDHPQWEMYSFSKHGVRYLLKQNKTLPESIAAPACQTCHMQDGNHNVRTGWGFLGVRLPLPDDKQWASDQTVILQALGILDPGGKQTDRVNIVKAANLFRLTEDDWQNERNKMIKICSKCHSKNFAKKELEKGDQIIKEADFLMAEAIRIVVGLYQDSILPKPKNYIYSFPDLLTFHDAPTVIEQKLSVMFLEHRMHTIQGAFHVNYDYAMWYGWSEMQKDLTEIRAMAENLQKDYKK